MGRHGQCQTPAGSGAANPTESLQQVGKRGQDAKSSHPKARPKNKVVPWRGKVLLHPAAAFVALKMSFPFAVLPVPGVETLHHLPMKSAIKELGITVITYLWA